MASLYLHIPFCERKCIYCDFYSIESLTGMDRFVQALRREIEMSDVLAASETIETVFFGGGTPSLLDGPTVSSLMDLLRGRYRIEENAEVTLEANPGTVTDAKLEAYRLAGVNRLSFGVQSFFEDDLHFLSRIHTSEEAVEAVSLARRCGFENINIDLIFALPGQTKARWRENLRRAIDLHTKHISAYSLIVEDGTPLARMFRAKQVSPAPTSREAEMYEETMETMERAGFEHYEVSNYALPGFRSRHNCNYWNHSTYVGFGPSAHSFCNGRRWWNVSNLKIYNEKALVGESPISGQEVLTASEVVEERIMLGLRTGGIQLTGITDQNGLLSAARTKIDHFLRDRLIELEGSTLRLTSKGFLFCDEITAELLASVDPA